MSSNNLKCIFIHGNSSSEILWKPFQNILAQYFDFQAHNVGYPSRVANKALTWSKSRIVDDIFKNIPKDFKSNPIIFGHSLGGHLAIELASKLPSLNQLVLFQCSPARNIQMLSEYFDETAVSGGLMFNEKWSKDDHKVICDELSYPHKSTEDFRNSININNEKLRKDLGSSLASEGLEDEWELLNKIKAQKSLFLFDSDPIMKTNKIKQDLKELDSLKVVISKAKGHYGLYYEPEILSQEVQSLILKTK
ncbi:MAG: alpha/beta hydrolase [Bdellovibrionales bacterium]|nr:alpha/beta hydrolase [Bdellovibrionales bacterium]